MSEEGAVRMTVLLVAVCVVGCGCASGPRKPTSKELERSKIVERQQEWDAAAPARAAAISQWRSENPGHPVPWRLNPNRPRYWPRDEEVHQLVTEYMADRLGQPESLVFDAPPTDSCKVTSMHGRRYDKRCRFRFNWPDLHPYTNLTVKFQDGKAIDWDLD